MLLTTFGSFGDLHPYMALGLELQARGHQAIIGTSELYRAKVESAGLEFMPLRPDLPSVADAGDFARRVMHERHGTEVVIRELALGSLRESFEDIQKAAVGCDLIVSHALTYGSPMVAQSMGIPWVFVALQPVILFSAEDASVPPNVPWAIGFRRVFGAKAYRVLMDLGMRPYQAWAEPIYKLRSELGLPPSPSGNPILRGQYSPFLNLALFSRALAPPASDWTDGTVQTGFAFYDSYDAMQPPMSAELREFIEVGDAPLVFTLGTAAVRHAGNFFEQSIDAARRVGRRAVLLTGVETGNAAMLKAAPDFFVADYAPYRELMALGAVNIHQGGIGTTGQALRAGKPMLVVPFAHDQLDNAARCVRLGVAEMLPRGKYNASSAAKQLARLLSDPDYRTNAENASRLIAEENGTITACDAIEKLPA